MVLSGGLSNHPLADLLQCLASHKDRKKPAQKHKAQAGWPDGQRKKVPFALTTSQMPPCMTACWQTDERCSAVGGCRLPVCCRPPRRAGRRESLIRSEPTVENARAEPVVLVRIAAVRLRRRRGVVLMRSTPSRWRLGVVLVVLALGASLVASAALARSGAKRPARPQVQRINFVEVRGKNAAPVGTTCTNDFRLIHGGVTLGSATASYTIDTSGSGLGGSAATA